MSVRKLTASLIAILFVLGGMSSSKAQQRFENLPPADPFAFNPDFNWFEPVYNLDLEDMKSKHRAPRGWFGTYDRLYLYGSRPENDDPQDAETVLDSGWGHRYEVGYMGKNDRGYTFNWTRHNVAQSFIIRALATDIFTVPQTAGASGGASTTSNLGFIRPAEAGNQLGTSLRFFDVEDSQNVFTYNSFEFNKTWRMEPYHYGGILEPFIGFRYMRVNDINRLDSLQTVGDVITVNNAAVGPNLGFVGDLFTRDENITENDLIGGQFGFRYFKYRNRFTYSADFRVFLGENFQQARFQRQSVAEVYNVIPPIAPGTVPDDFQFEATSPTYERNEEFFVGFDLRGELSYQLTRMISLRAGLQLIDIGTGVWRGGSTQASLQGGDNDQDLVLIGGSFGISLNH